MANVTFTNVYQRFLDGVTLLNFDLSWIPSAGCLLEVDFHDRMLWTTIAPLVIMSMLGGTYIVAIRKNCGSPENILQNIRLKHVSMALLLTFLVYSTVSSMVFQMFACDPLDDGKRYLRADYSIECDSPKHRALQIYAGLMILLYPVGIPALYASLLFSNRGLLQDSQRRKESPVVRATSELWKQYKPKMFYYEVIECCRRLLLAGVVVFTYPNTGAQIALTLAIATLFVFVSEALAPYQSHWDRWISRISHAIVFVTMYLAFLLKVSVSSESSSSQKNFEVVLVAAHGCLILAVVFQAVILAWSFRVETQRENVLPRRRRSLTIYPAISRVVGEDDICKVEL